MDEECEERNVLVAGAGVGEEKECGRAVRIREAREEGEVAWKIAASGGKV